MSRKTAPLSLRLEKYQNWENPYIVPKKQYSNFFILQQQIKKIVFNLYDTNINSITKIKIIKNAHYLTIYVFVIKKVNNLKPFQANFKKKNIYTIKKKTVKTSQRKNNYRQNVFKLLNKLKKTKLLNILKHMLKLQNIFLVPKVFVINSGVKVLNNKSKQYEHKLKKLSLNLKKNAKQISFFFNCVTAIKLKSSFLLHNIIQNELKINRKPMQILSQFDSILKVLLKTLKPFKGCLLNFKGKMAKAGRTKRIKKYIGIVPERSFSKTVHYNQENFLTFRGVCSLKVVLYFE